MPGDDNKLTKFASIEATSSFESDEEALEALVQLKELDFGDLFTNRDTQLEPDEEQGISIHFYHDEVSNSLNLNTDSDSSLRIHLSLADEDIGKSATVLNSILEIVKPIIQKEITIFKEFNRTFQSLELPIQEGSDLEVVGIRVRRDQTDYIIQGTENDQVLVTVRREEEREFEDRVPEDIVLEDINQATEFIEEEL